MSEITQLLQRIESGELQAADRLLPLVYQELRMLATARMRNEQSEQLLQATALVHEAYLRLVDVKRIQNWKSRAHFFGAAAEAMRRILVEQARKRSSLKQGNGLKQHVLDENLSQEDNDADRVIDIDFALERLTVQDPGAAEVVKLHIFGGLTLDEVAEALEISRASVFRSWAFARAMLKLVLRDEVESPRPGM